MPFFGNIDGAGETHADANVGVICVHFVVAINERELTKCFVESGGNHITESLVFDVLRFFLDVLKIRKQVGSQ